jgi:DNA-binding XRE family transcriptional regulator
MSASTAATCPGRPWTATLDGRRLRQLRREHSLSQEQLAHRAGISLTTVARLERQIEAPCRGWTVARLAAALGQQPTTLIAASARPYAASPRSRAAV